MFVRKFLVCCLVPLVFFSCNESPEQSVAVKRIVDGKVVVDTSAYTLPSFQLQNHFGDTVTEKDVAGKIIVADFFFIQCPSICPRMKAQMLRVHETFKQRDDVLILSHTIDPKRDSVAALKAYAEKLEIKKNWWFLTGNRDSLFSIADKYLISAEEDPGSPGGFAHSGNFILIDKKGKIRGYYDGTNEQSVSKLIKDIGRIYQAK